MMLEFASPWDFRSQLQPLPIHTNIFSRLAACMHSFIRCNSWNNSLRDQSLHNECKAYLSYAYCIESAKKPNQSSKRSSLIDSNERAPQLQIPVMSHPFLPGGGGRQVMINGKMYEGEELEEYCDKNGLCPLCGEKKVKRKKTGLFSSIYWEQIEIQTNRRGDIEVYKGYHISPKCYSMAQAKEALGETDDDDVQKHARKKKNRGKSREELLLTISDRSKDEHKPLSQLPDPEPFPMPDTMPILDSAVKLFAPGDDELHTSGGSSSQEHQSSLISGDQTQAEASKNYGIKLDHTQSPQQSNTNLDSHIGWRVRSDGHIRIPSSEKVARRPLSSSDPSINFRHPPSPNHETHPSSQNLPTIPSITLEDPVKAGIREISEDAERLDVYHFLIHLDCHRAKAEVLQTGLSLMREIVFDLHQSHPEKRYVFPNDGWCKSIKSAMSEHADDTTIQMEGAMTITFICSVSHKYKADLIRNHNASEVIAAIQTHPEAKEMCCVALECLSRKEGTQSATWREDHALDAFEAIKSVLSDPSHPGTSYAVLALYNLSTHDNFRQEFVKEHILVILVQPGVMDTLSALLQDDSVSEEVMEAITSLLQRFWVRLLEDGNAYALSSSPEAMLGALVGAMYIFGSETLHSGICELLTKIPIPTSTDLMWKQTLSDAIVNAMTRHSLVEAVQLAGLTALCSLFSDPSRREEYVADLERIAEVIVFAMENFHQNADLAAQGCLTLASICSTGDWYQDTVTKKGGAAAIVNAFRSFVINGDPSLRSKTENVRLAASSALTSLSRSNAAASVLRDSNVLVDFQNMLATNGDVYLSDPSIRTCALNLISASLIESNESPEATLDIAAKFLVQNIDEADAQMILSILSILCSRSPTAIDSIMIAGEGTGTSRVVALLEDFPENACIQENGCALLSNIYFQVPFQGELDQSTYVSIGLRSVQIRTHSAREITLISSALDNHKVNVNVVKNACEALCNFVCGLNVVVTDPVDFHVSQSVAERFSGIPKEVDSALAIHEENPEVMQPVLRLLLVAVRLLNDVEMQRYSANLIARLFEIMIRFPQDEDIHQCACSILGRFVSIENESILASMANAEGLRALLLSLQMEKETVVKFTTGILSSLLREVPTLINDVIEMAEYFQCLVNCLYRFPESVPIQAETCSILVSLATLSDSYVKAIIANSGGVNAVMLALQTHRNQSYVLEYACKALAGIAEGILDTILFSSRENICNELLTTLAYSTNMEGVIFATMEALCEFCSRDDYFDDQLFIANAVPNIVEAMAQHVHSGDVQQAGCKLLWLLSLKNDEYKQVLGASGAIQALVTALLGHITSTAVVKEALTAIKHVSRISANKDALQQSKATDAIRLAIYSNLAESQVLSAALSALNDIAVDASTREVTSVSDETMNSVLAATRTHPSDNEVQKIACWLLRSYTFNERNLALMRASSDELVQLLLSASSLFPEECVERADYIIQKIYESKLDRKPAPLSRQAKFASGSLEVGETDDDLERFDDEEKKRGKIKEPTENQMKQIGPPILIPNSNSKRDLPTFATGSLEIDTLVDRKDIFSLTCMLRAKGDKRLYSALALMRFSRDAQRVENDEAMRLRDETISLGGMHSLLALFHSKGATRELKVVVSLAVAYQLPSIVTSSTLPSACIGLKIVECLHFLFTTSNPVMSRGEEISVSEMRRASVMGVRVLYYHIVSSVPSKEEVAVDRPFFAVRRAHLHLQIVEIKPPEVSNEQYVLEMIVSLVILMARSCSESDDLDSSFVHLVGDICSIDIVYPITIRNGILETLVTWMQSQDADKIRCAVISLKQISCTDDRYTAGWLHSKIVNEDALMEIEKLSVSKTVTQDVRLAVAEILQNLCLAPHTRGTGAQTRYIDCLVSLLYGFDVSPSENVAFVAGSALLQLMKKSFFHIKADDAISLMVHGGAISQFVAMARSKERTKLRTMAVEAIQVLSEDNLKSRRTKFRLCEDGTAGALAHVLKDNVEGDLSATIDAEHDYRGFLAPNYDVELHLAIRALANIFERNVSPFQASSDPFADGDKDVLLKACYEIVEVGGLESLLYVATLPLDHYIYLVTEACRCLASISPFFLSSGAASRGYAGWSVLVCEALARVLSNASDFDDVEAAGLVWELKFEALRGIGALASYEPIKLIIIDKYLPTLFHVKVGRGSDVPSFVTGAANQVCTSIMGLGEVAFVQQSAANDPNVIGGLFCLQRSLLVQSMARAELHKAFGAIWGKPFQNIKDSRSYSGDEIRALDVFETLAFEVEGFDTRNIMMQQYHDVYEKTPSEGHVAVSSQAILSWRSSESETCNLLADHVYPLNSTEAERDWILPHRQFMRRTDSNPLSISAPDGLVSGRVQQLLDSCIPSRLIQEDVLPIYDLRPASPFDFRCLAMPQGRYFSFRREGELVSRLCDTNASLTESDNTYLTVGFTNSSFAGEFSETLIRTLYLCPLIRGISFKREDNWQSEMTQHRDEEERDEADMLAKLAGSLPPSVSSIIFDNTLNDYSFSELATILEAAGRQSTNKKVSESLLFVGQKKGSFHSIAVCNSPHLGADSWRKFFGLLGRSPEQLSSSYPLQSLKVLDLSGNNLGDLMSSLVLKLSLDKESGCSLERLDLSSNNIRQGSHVALVLCGYVNRYRHNSGAGIAMKDSWKTPLDYLNLGSNDLKSGELALEVTALLANNALSLKSLDLSNNGIVGQGSQFVEVLLASLMKNTCLRHLNLSENEFSLQCIDQMLEVLKCPDSDSSLAFLRFEKNEPPLTESQRESLNDFTSTSRTDILQRCIFDDMKEMLNGFVTMLQNDPPDGKGPSPIKGESSVSLSSLDTPSDDTSDTDESFGGNDGNGGSGSSNRPDGGESAGFDNTLGRHGITVLFSAPLVFTDADGNLRPFEKLDFETEKQLLSQSLKDSHRDIKLLFDNATYDRLLIAKARNCGCLHYSGHGHPSQTDLPFENGKGSPHWINVETLRRVVERRQGQPFKLVFVSACYSRLAGERFVDAGVPHVVCCRQDSEVKDAAAIAFTRQFYVCLALGHTVQESFEEGCNAVLCLPSLRNPTEEMQKFILLPEGGSHDISLFSEAGHAVNRPPLRYKSSRMSFRSSPAPPRYFTGREVDMYRVLNAVLSNPLVSVISKKDGIGRSSLVHGLCRYIKERIRTISCIDRIFYLSCKQSNTFSEVLHDLLRLRWNAEDGINWESIRYAVCKKFYKVKALLVIDQTELLENPNDRQDLIMFLSILFCEEVTEGVRVLRTGEKILGVASIGAGVPEVPYFLGPLNFKSTVILFSRFCYHLRTASDRRRFLERLVTDDSQGEIFPNDEGAPNRIRLLFPTLGNGIPSEIVNAAFSISPSELERLGNETAQ